MAEKVTVPEISRMKQRGEKITALTAYDYSFARILDEAGVDILLVGDSLGSVIQGQQNTLPVTLDEMIYHTKAVVRGRKRALVVADMPFLSFQVSVEEAKRNAGRFLQEAGAEAVKIEGGVHFLETIEAIVRMGIPVMGHVGLTPQSVHRFGGYKVQELDSSFDLDRLRPGLLEESPGVPLRLLDAHLKGKKRHVRDHERPFPAPDHRFGMIDHLIQGDGQSVLLPLDHRAQRVPDEQDIHPGLIKDAGERVIVGSQGGDLFTPLLHPADFGHGNFFRHRAALLKQKSLPDQSGKPIRKPA